MTKIEYPGTDFRFIKPPDPSIIETDVKGVTY